MSLAENLAKFDKIFRPIASKFSNKFYIDLYSRGRREFLNILTKEQAKNIDIDSWNKPKTLWNIKFNNPIFNAAGMFKNGNGYYMSAQQGAGAWLAGTSTALPRVGNLKHDIKHPFIPLPKSHSAINWLGLPNDGHLALADKISKINKIYACPIGVSISSDPSQTGLIALNSLISAFNTYDSANVDFIELNESCPNVVHSEHTDKFSLDPTMLERIDYLSSNFLRKRNRNLPVIAKYSVDTSTEHLAKLIPILIDAGFDGINLGNTSTCYNEYLDAINKDEINAYNYFINNFGGGVSGNVIKDKSIKLCNLASQIIQSMNLNKEFHIIRTGGIENSKDLSDSENAGVSLNQWYTGYFENFSNYGHKLYKNLLS
jgi:dihydroorotate dehydrogenase